MAFPYLEGLIPLDVTMITPLALKMTMSGLRYGKEGKTARGGLVAKKFFTAFSIEAYGSEKEFGGFENHTWSWPVFILEE